MPRASVSSGDGTHPPASLATRTGAEGQPFYRGGKVPFTVRGQTSRMIRAAFLVSALLAGPLLSAQGWADGDGTGATGRCGASREGALACMAGRACLCRHERGGQLTGRPDGFRWDCGALRPDCGPAPAGDAAAELPAGTMAGPEAGLPHATPPWREPPR